MRTTIDIPDDLLRRAKATAAIRGVKLKDLVATILDAGLRADSTPEAPAPKGQGRPVPVALSTQGQPFQALTNAELEAIFLREDLERAGFG